MITAVARMLVTIANALCKNRQNWAALAPGTEIQLLRRVGHQCRQVGAESDHHADCYRPLKLHYPSILWPALSNR